MADWYEQHIEEGIRPLVKLLRDNGFNTTCSCHHDMQVMLDPVVDGSFQRLHELLSNNGHRDYSVQFNLNVKDGHVFQCWAQVSLCTGHRPREEGRPEQCA